jgi:transcriptional regulator with PAS, ATPase and Fis domain
MYTIKIPPLRERKKDILPLARYFLQRYGNSKTDPIESLSPELEQCLVAYSFPGNIRELENIMASAVLLEKSRILTLSSFRGLDPAIGSSADEGSGLATLEDLEKKHILRVLQETRGNRKKAAIILGINTATVYRKIEKYRISDKILKDNEFS